MPLKTLDCHAVYKHVRTRNLFPDIPESFSPTSPLSPPSPMRSHASDASGRLMYTSSSAMEPPVGVGQPPYTSSDSPPPLADVGASPDGTTPSIGYLWGLLSAAVLLRTFLDLVARRVAHAGRTPDPLAQVYADDIVLLEHRGPPRYRPGVVAPYGPGSDSSRSSDDLLPVHRGLATRRPRCHSAP